MISDATLEWAGRTGWRELMGSCAEPPRMQLLKRSHDGTAVYRLLGWGPAASPVIAKRARQATADVERAVYAEILPRVPVPAPHFYGAVEEPETGYWWLFMDEVRGSRYRREVPAHRVAAGRWLRVVHTSLADLVPPSNLPTRGAVHYRKLLRSGAEALSRRLADGKPASSARAVLETVLGYCEQLMERWSELEAACDGVRGTLVHGDFIDNNVRVRSAPCGPVVLPFDWEKAGWGPPAEDLSSVDLEAYAASGSGPAAARDRAALGRLAGAGRIFRCLVFLEWVLSGRDITRPDHQLEQIGLCRSWLDDLMERAEWGG